MNARNTKRNWTSLRDLLQLAAVLGLGLLPLRAQEPGVARPDPRDEVIRQLLQRVEALEHKLNGVEAQGAPRGQARSHAYGTDPALLEMPFDDIKAQQTYPYLTFRGFADVSFRYTQSRPTGAANSFALGQYDLFPTARLAENFSTFAEIVFGAGSDNKFNVAAERLIFQYTPSDWFNLNLGRYHTDLGYYNSAYHHGAWLQTAVGRPLIYTGAVPIHNIGFSINGQLPSGSLGLSYVLEVGNGRHYGPRTEEANLNVTDDNDHKAINFGLRMHPTWAQGLELGATIYHDQLTPTGLPETDQFIFVGHAAYKRSPWEFLAEGMVYRHKLGGTVTYVPGGYGQVAYQIGKFRPYVRYDYQEPPEEDRLFQTYSFVGQKHGPTVGVRWDFTEYAALKLQYAQVFTRGLPTTRSIQTQVSFTF